MKRLELYKVPRACLNNENVFGEQGGLLNILRSYHMRKSITLIAAALTAATLPLTATPKPQNPLIMNVSICIYGEANHETKHGLINISHTSNVVSIFVPELPGSNTHSIALIRSNDALNQKFIPILTHHLEVIAALISDGLGVFSNLFFVINFTFEETMNSFQHDLLGFLRAELIFERRFSLIRLLLILLCLLF